MLEVAKVGPQDYVIDLGSGDGRIVITAARKHGARGLGIEIDPQLVALANANARAAGLADRVQFTEADLFAADLSQASVVTIYLLTRATLKLRTKLFELKPGTRIVTNASSMGEWKPDHFEMMEVKDKVRPDAPRNTYIQLWVVPAKVAGVWRWTESRGAATRLYELMLSQQFQRISGKVRIDGHEMPIHKAHLHGDRISVWFYAESASTAVEHRLDGFVLGDSIAGTSTIVNGAGAREATWNATRASTSAPR
jgi:hypothetical protein